MTKGTDYAIIIAARSGQRTAMMWQWMQMSDHKRISAIERGHSPQRIARL